MTHPGLQQLVHGLRHALAPPRAAPADAELLARFAASDESAFELLISRHGPMVYQVCLRLLRHRQDAEDAFQATFLALAKKAGSVRRPEALAGWLHCTAHRAALRLRSRRPATVVPLDAEPAAREATDPYDGELLGVIEEEVRRLPEKYRLVVVLCYLEGRSTEEAAALLGCPRGTVFSRLAWARDRLRQRLARRGVTRPEPALALLAAGDMVPGDCFGPLTRAAAQVAAGGSAAGIVPARVLALTQGVLAMMWWSQLRAPIALLVGIVTVIGAASLFSRPAPGAAVPPRAAVARVAEDKKDDKAVSVATFPPVVVKTVPQAGDTAVDARAVKEIKVTFSKDMLDRNWSWTQISNETFPKVTGKIHYEKDKRTCVMPVKLEPGKTYVIWLNPPRFTSFKDTDGQSAVAYLLVFQTKR
jgi:RNA polymerase sigma-70 factor (ECF subfamily)